MRVVFLSTAALFAAVGLALPTPEAGSMPTPRLARRQQDRASVEDKDLVFVTTPEENEAKTKCMLAKVSSSNSYPSSFLNPCPQHAH